MIVANHQPQYIPYLGFFQKIARCDLLLILDDVQFLERGHQHRNLIKMQTGTQWLTVPVQQRRGQLIHEVMIDNAQTWRRKHWAALQTNYSKAQHFKTYAEELRAIIEGGTHVRLQDLDIELLQWVFDKLGITAKMRLSSELKCEGERSVKHINLTKAVGATTYLSGSGGRQYMELPLFEEAGIKVEFADFTAREYPQLFPQHGFIPNLSVVDALFNVGAAGVRELIQ